MKNFSNLQHTINAKRKENFIQLNFESLINGSKFSIRLYSSDFKTIINQFNRNKDFSFDLFSSTNVNRNKVVFYENFETVIFRFERVETNFDFSLNISDFVEIEKMLNKKF